jgi:hypothetical protein
VVSLPNSLLASGLVIADTPGFGAAQSDLLHGSHEEALIDYLRNVSQVFWVVLAEQGIGSREKHFHDTFFSHVCDDLIVTGCDDWEPDDCARFRKRFADALASRLVRFHFVSGKKGAEARTANDDGGLEKAGITSLTKRLQELADPVGREAVVQTELDQLARDIAWWFSEYRDRRGRPVPHWWRPDSWYRFAAFATGDPFAGSLKQNLEEPT